jgi:4-amino-4-deoxychorismate lyase
MSAVLVLLELAPDGLVRGSRRVDPAAAVLSAADLAATRGDGVFETVSIAHGHPQALEAHLARMGRSAAMLDLGAVDVDGWRAAVHEVADALADEPESWVKIVLSRGVEGSGIPSGFAWGAPSPDHRIARSDGVRAVTLDRGLRSDAAATSPWLLAGAKTLSYGVNMAAKREAARRGADDVIFVSSDGLLLEGPTANLVLRIAGELVTPALELGILPGTSQADLFRWAETAGIPTAYRRLPVSALDDADAAWLVSSVRHAAPLHTIDDRRLDVDREVTAGANAFLLGRTE